MADRRVGVLSAHLSAPAATRSSDIVACPTVSLKKFTTTRARKPPTKWNGWGYEDTRLYLNQDGVAALSGTRYPHIFPARRIMPKFRGWVEDVLGIDIRNTSPANRTKPELPPPFVNKEFMDAISDCAESTFDDGARLDHAHGATCQEVFRLRYGSFDKYPDVVVFPSCHDDVEALVAAAVKHDVCIIPFGGGTSVSAALEIPERENRMVVSCDMKRMNHICWINHKTSLACVEAGAVGIDLQEALDAYGVTLGHEPDSSEFSTVGGWVATRASGMKKNAYGNIEDLVVNLKMVTPSGTFTKQASAPRSSTGPDLTHIALGSEGILGIITEVTFRISPTPAVQEYDSVLFPDFETGIACMHHLTREGAVPAALRLQDNMQFQFGQALSAESGSPMRASVIDKIKKYYVTQIKNFDPESMVVATIVYEGKSEQDVKSQKKALEKITAGYSGMHAGAENGLKGYFLTYMIAYMRDFGFEFNFMAESFETSVAWDAVVPMCESVKERIFVEAAARGVRGRPFVSCRLSQTYDT
jgi:alkyldihydroxyacetonephosphate synthase